MIFTCKNCGGNVIFNPTLGTMYCPHCSGTDTEETKPDAGIVTCTNCGAELKPGEYTSAMICPACGSSVVFDERMAGDLRPAQIIPFKIDREKAVEIIEKHISRRIFTPNTFVAEKNLKKLKGTYLPFWLYDFDANMYYRATATRTRSWYSGEYHYTETSTYQVMRDMNFIYNGIPADASAMANDSRMDLLEPFNYGEIKNFEEKYMSGFLGENQSVTKEDCKPRVIEKAKNSAIQYVRATVNGYQSIRDEQVQFTTDDKATVLDLFPVWEYTVPYKNQNYVFQINGQTGKIVGETPIAAGRVFAYSGFLLVSLITIAMAVLSFLEVL